MATIVITVNGTYEVSDRDDVVIDVPGGGDVTIVAPTGDDDNERFFIDFGGDDGVSDVVHIDLSTFDEDGLRIEIENYDPTDQIDLIGAFNIFVDPLFPDEYTFDYIGEDGNTYSGEVRAKDAGEDDFTTDPPPIIICYAPGTMIDTPDGPRAIETLRPGDMVNTLDNDAQEILWVHHDDQPLEAVERDAKPILIAAGALGKGRPAQDLIVSPQHRMLVGGGGQLRGQFNTEAFAPAKSLTSLPGIRPMMGKPQITWFHFACKAHEVVFANGCFSESLLLGPIVLNGLTGTELLALTDIFGSAPTPDAALNGPPARNCLKVGAVRRQLKENDKEKRHHRAKENRNWDVDLAMEQYETERLREAKATNQLREHLLGFA